MADSEFHAVIDALMRPSSRSRDGTSAHAVNTVAVLGAGPLGQLLACAFLASGAKVRLFSAYGNDLAALRERGGITVRGEALTGTYRVSDSQPREPAIELAATVDHAIAGADVVLIATPASAHEIHAGLLAGRLSAGQTVVLAPGRFLGSVAFARVLRRQLATGTTIAELDTPPFLVSGPPGQLVVHAVAQRVGCAALDASATESLVDGLRPGLPSLVPSPSVLDIAFGGISALLYAVPVLLAVSEVERAHAESRTVLLRDLITHGIASTVIKRVDAERRNIAFRYGVRDLPSAAQQLAQAFGGDGDNLAEAVRSSTGFDELAVPAGNQGGPHVIDEVPYSLVPLASAGAATGVRTPATDSLIGVASALVGIDFGREGRTLATIGLDGIAPEKLRRLLDSGNALGADALWQVS